VSRLAVPPFPSSLTHRGSRRAATTLATGALLVLAALVGACGAPTAPSDRAASAARPLLQEGDTTRRDTTVATTDSEYSSPSVKK